MGLKKATLLFSALFIVPRVYHLSEQTSETHYMLEACSDISKYNLFRAESDVDSVMAIIERHAHPHSGQGQINLYEVMSDLSFLEEEMEFHNTDQEYYRMQFGLVLNKLAYAQLLEAKAYMDEQNTEAASSSINEACHLYHDALFFLEGSEFVADKKFLRKLQSLGNVSPETGMDEYLDQARKLTDL